MNTHYGPYSPDPLPIRQQVQLPIQHQETVGEMKAITPPPVPHQPTIEPLSHSGVVRNPVDQLASHSQRAIEKYCDEILTIVSSCRCDLCKNCVKTLLSDLIGEVLTDTTIVTLALGKQQREFERFTYAIERLMPNILGREAHK